MAFSYKNYTESDAVKKKRQEAESHSTYTASDSVNQAKAALENHEANKVADWTGGTYGEALKGAIDKINNREKFTYDLNGDALYQQYKDQYMSQGKLAMADTIGQASAMTGGYGNSYAATAGNQAYQGYLTKLNDVVPELYQLAYDKYNQEGQDLYNQYNLYNDAYNTEYGEYRDKVTDWNNEASRLSDRYYNEANLDYTQFSNDRDYYNTAYNNERTYDYGQYSDEYSRAFSNYQQQVSEDQYAKNLALQQAQLAETIRANKASEALSAQKAQASASQSAYDSAWKQLGYSSYEKAEAGLKAYAKSNGNEALFNLLVNSGLTDADVQYYYNLFATGKAQSNKEVYTNNVGYTDIGNRVKGSGGRYIK